MKEYVKPELYYESFELSQHIAGCNLTLEQESALVCDASGDISGDYLDGSGDNKGWFLSTDICSVTVESVCYSNGSASHVTINS